MEKRKKKRIKNKNGNGLGCITYLGNNRKNCYGVKVTIGWTSDGKQIRKYIGYASSKTEAEKIRSKYLLEPNSASFDTITFEDLYEKWLEEQKKLQEKANNGENVKALSAKGLSRYTGVYRNYYKKLYNRRFNSITNYDIQLIVDSCPAGYYTKSDIKGLYKKLQDFLESKKSTNTKYINIGVEEKSDMHKPFTDEEIKKLWENKSTDYAEPILIQIYAGLRPTELLTIEEFHLKEKYMVGGIKTEAGKNRTIPIHDKIIPLVEKWLISGNLKISYQTYRKNFKKTLKSLNMDISHTPHDCRHTTATLLNRYNANDVCVKLILGHEIDDITKGTYTHKTNQELIDTINLIAV